MHFPFHQQISWKLDVTSDIWIITTNKTKLIDFCITCFLTFYFSIKFRSCYIIYTYLHHFRRKLHESFTDFRHSQDQTNLSNVLIQGKSPIHRKYGTYISFVEAFAFSFPYYHFFVGLVQVSQVIHPLKQVSYLFHMMMPNSEHTFVIYCIPCRFSRDTQDFNAHTHKGSSIREKRWMTTGHSKFRTSCRELCASVLAPRNPGTTWIRQAIVFACPVQIWCTLLVMRNFDCVFYIPAALLV